MSETVSNGELQRLSASSINTFRICPRKWWFKYVAGEKETVGKGAVRGQEGHKRIEHYLTTGENVLDNLERKAMSFMPDPAKPFFPFAVELGITIGDLYLQDIPLVGSIDLIVFLPGVADITDWKFKKSIDTYGASAEELTDSSTEAGLQTVAYARFAVDQGYDNVIVRHVTFQTQGRAEVVATAGHMTRDQVIEQWARAESIVPAIKEVAKKKSWKDVDISCRKEGACEMYRGCQFAGRCFDPLAQMAENLRKKD